MAFIAGVIANTGVKTKLRVIVAAVTGSLSYVVLYLGKTFITQYIILGNPWQTVAGVLVTKGVTSLLNALLAMVISVIFFCAFSYAEGLFCLFVFVFTGYFFRL